MTKAQRAFSIALLLDGKGGARELSDAEVAQWTPGDGLLWVDLNLTNRRARKWLTEKSGIDGNVSSILLAEETRPRSLAIENGLYELWDADTAVSELNKLVAANPNIRDIHFWAQFPGESVESGNARLTYIAENVLPRLA